jgi:hypothetical protein
MTGSTVNLGLKTYNVGVDGTLPFFNFVSDVSGSSPASNMNKIDNFAGALQYTTIEILMGDGTSDITPGIAAYIEMPYTFTVTSVSIFANTSGSLTVDIWKDTYANYPPTDLDSVTSATPPTLFKQNKYRDVALSGWTVTWNKDDIVAINIDFAEGVTMATLSLKGYINI